MHLCLQLVVVTGLMCCSSSEQDSESHNTSENSLRIVSLSPAMTRTLVDLGLGESVVGRTPWCSSVHADIPVVGNLDDIDFERLVRLQPTHVVVQPRLKTGLNPQLVEIAGEHGWSINQWTLNSIDDIEEMILDIPAALAGDDAERRSALARKASDWSNRLAAVLSPHDEGELWTGGTMIVAQTDPVLVYGHTTYLHDLLVAMGGQNVIQGSGWVELSLEDVVRIDPQAILVTISEPEAGRTPIDVTRKLADLPIGAIQDNRIAMVAHKDINLPSSAIIEVADAMREALRALSDPDR